MRSSIICLFINLFVGYSTNGQTIPQIASFGKPGIISTSNLHFGPGSQVHDTTNSPGLYPVPLTLVSSNYYTNTLGFFCKKELQIEKALKFPVKFRLGSVAYTDKMEGKGTGVVLPGGKR